MIRWDWTMYSMPDKTVIKCYADKVQVATISRSTGDSVWTVSTKDSDHHSRSLPAAKTLVRILISKALKVSV